MILGGGGFGYELSINIGYAIGLMMGAYVAIGVSGAHLNPAVTLGMVLRGKTKLIMVSIISYAQKKLALETILCSCFHTVARST